jgi:pilus assembly protein CpaE
VSVVAQKSTSTPLSAPPAAQGRFLAALRDDVTRETARSVAIQLGWRTPEVHEGGVNTMATLIKSSTAPALLLVDISGAEDPLSAMDELAVHCGQETRVVVVGLENDVGLYRRLLAIGVSDYLVKPVSGPVLAEAIEAATRVHDPEPDHPRAARVIAMIGSRGGVGATALALSAGWLVARTKKVVVLDLDLHFGSAALSLDLELGRGLHEILTNPDRIDSLLIGSAMTTAGERLQILGGEDSLEECFDSDRAGLTALMANLAGAADCILVDAPRSLNDLSRQVLGMADMIVVVTDQSLAAMRDTRRLLSLARSLKPSARTLVIANRVGGVAGEVSRVDFERGIAAKIDVTVPFDAKAATAAAERGKTLADVARNPATIAALRSLAAILMGVSAPPKTSLLDRLMGK